MTFVFVGETALEDVKSSVIVDDKTAHLQSEVNRIAAAMNTQPLEVGVVRKDDDRNIYIDDHGRYHYDYWERGQDSRRLLWAKQYELLHQLNPLWARRCVRETADKLRHWGLDKDVELLPDIPERDG